MTQWQGLAIVIITAVHLVGGVAAFGSSLLAMAILVAVGGTGRVEECVGVLAWCGLLQASIIAAANLKHVRWREAGYALAAMAVFVWLGRHATSMASPLVVRAVLGLLLIAGGLSQLAARRTIEAFPPHWLRMVVLAVAGCVHGGFASGGTGLVPYLRLRLPWRDAFRATLSVGWVGLNAMLAAMVFVSATSAKGGSPPDASGELLFVVLACAGALAATLVGHRIARKLNEKAFAKVVAGSMLASGLLYILSPLWN